MGKRKSDECVDCGLPCLGSMCRYKNVEIHYCDDCGEEDVTIYEFEGEELCLNCIERRLDKVCDF